MKQRINLPGILSIVVILAGIFASFADSNPNSSRLVTIAVVESEAIPEAQSAYAGVKLAVDEFNAAAENDGIHIDIERHADVGILSQIVDQARNISDGAVVAVIQNSSFEMCDAAAAVYESGHIPAINIGPMPAELMVKHPYYFNITYTLESEAAYLANYLRKINVAETASIIYTDDTYGQTLASQFENTFRGLGGGITFKEKLDAGKINDEDLQSIVSTIISLNPEKSPPGSIFIATDDATAARLVILMKRAGVTYPILGPGNMSSPSFLHLIGQQSEEASLPGYFTNGILTTRSLIFDSSNRYANQFLRDYQAKYGQDDPGDLVINGYDGALAVLDSIQKAYLAGADIATNRKNVFEALRGMDKADNGVQGLLDSIYFAPSRNVVRAARFGVYQSGDLASANTQFESIHSLEEAGDLQAQIDKGRIMTVNGDYVYASNVVYAGVDIFGIDEIDLKTATYKIDFYLWFRYRPHEQDEEFAPANFVFTNAKEGVESVLVREETNADGTILRTYRVSGVFKSQFAFHDYPFDEQKLVIEFRNQNATTSFIQYVVDRAGMRYSSDGALLENFKDNGAFDSLFGWEPGSVHVGQDIFPSFSTFGSPQNFDSRVSTDYSLINFEVGIKRDSLQYVFKSLLPLLITLILAYITFFLPLGHSERLAVGSTALLTTAFFHLSLADALPEIGYTVAMEYLFYASYVMSALIVLLETLSIRLEKRAGDSKKRSEKVTIEKHRHDLDMIGRIVYPSILGFVLLAGSFIYNGSIHLGPKEETGARSLAGLIPGRNQIASNPVPDTAQPSAPTDEVTLTLGNWRPEDIEQMQSLLAEFEAYALDEHGKSIHVEYKPMMSRNYDSILDMQFARDNGPDLLYVRPFSVDGQIAKYLIPLNDLPIDKNYDETKIVPWRDRAGIVYAVPFVGVVQGVYYNKDLFTRYGIAVPTSWEEFLFYLETIRAQDPTMIPIANALNESEDSEMFMSVAANFLGGPGGRELLMRADGGGLCYNSRPVVNSFRAIEEMKLYLPRDAARMNSQSSKELFFNEQAVMLFGGSWDLLTVDEKAKFNWDVFAVPAPRSMQTYVIFQPDVAIGVSRYTDHAEEAKLFLEWLMSKQAVDLIARKLPGFYPLNKIEAQRGSDVNDAKFLKLVNQYPADIRWMYTEISGKNPGALDSVRESLYQMAAFDLSPETASQNLQNDLAEWYQPAQACRQEN